MGGRSLVYFAPYWIGVGALRMLGRQIPRTQVQDVTGIRFDGEQSKAGYQEKSLIYL